MDIKEYTFGSKNNHLKNLVEWIKDNAADEVLQIVMLETEWLELADIIAKAIQEPVNGDYNCFSCPNCGQEYECTPLRPKCCDNCGQAFDLSNIPDWEEIDWSMEEEGEE